MNTAKPQVSQTARTMHEEQVRLISELVRLGYGNHFGRAIGIYTCLFILQSVRGPRA